MDQSLSYDRSYSHESTMVSPSDANPANLTGTEDDPLLVPQESPPDRQSYHSGSQDSASTSQGSHSGSLGSTLSSRGSPTSSQYEKRTAPGEEESYSRDQSVVDVFRELVLSNPNKVAVTDDSTQLTYAQLELWSDELSRHLHQFRLPVESLVGVLAKRSCMTIVAFIGILKAKLAYLPLDVSAPADRIENILSSISGRKLVLLGADVLVPQVQMDGIDYVPIKDLCHWEHSQTKQEAHQPTSAIIDAPHASSLAYVMFTSGSTGKPKGVMIEHRGIVRLIKHTNLVPRQHASGAVAHVSNIAFDASTLEIYTALLNGGTLVCASPATVLDTAALSQLLLKESVRVAFLTPALLKQYLAESPSTIAELDVLLTGADVLQVEDARKARSLVNGIFLNLYGPTENTVVSTRHSIAYGEEYTNGVPIGHAVSDSGAYVMDAQQRMLPPGSTGELVVTGDGLARGYLDPKLDHGRFVEVNIDGHLTRAYRTGDYVRERPGDRLLEYFGRIDHQVKIRGNRVELAEVELALLGQRSVTNAVAIVVEQEGKSAEIVSFVTVEYHDGVVEDDGGDAESGQVEVWKNLYETQRYLGLEGIHGEQLGRDFQGWTSMYDGKLIDKADMSEWLDDTIRLILNGSTPGHVLEVGTGTGMILFNILDGLESYLGIDPAESAATFVLDAARSLISDRDLKHKIKMQVGSATDVRGLELQNPPSLVVVNSVVQHFPSPDYLLKAAQDLASLPGCERIFLGDLRSYALYHEFRVDKALHAIGDAATKDEFRKMIADLESKEEELLVDPGSLTGMLDRLSDLIEHVEILPKKMRATNELSCYRYAAVLYVKNLAKSPLQIHDVAPDDWSDFQHRGLTAATLLHLLQGAPDTSVICISNIPEAKTVFQRHVVDSLASEGAGDLDWLIRAREAAQRCPSLSAFELEQLGRREGYQVEVSCARQYSQRGGLDAVFHRGLATNNGQRVLFKFPTDHTHRPTHSLSSRPLQRKLNLKIETQLRNDLLSKFPSYTVPKVIRVLDSMPINGNGKVDRQALSSSAPGILTQLLSPNAGAQPTTEAEMQLQALWSSVLCVDSRTIGSNTSFLEIGGDSIQAMRLVGEARCQGLILTVADVLANPRLSALADKIRRPTEIAVDEAIPPFSILQGAAAIQAQAASVCGVDGDDVQDILPCTPLQEGLLAMTARRQGDYVIQHVLELEQTVNEMRFKRAWEEVVAAMSIFRTRIIAVADQRLVQVVLADRASWRHGNDLEEYPRGDREEAMGMSCVLRREALIQDNDTNKRFFVLTIHHALYDGWTMRLIMGAVARVYQGEALAPFEPFARFIKHIYNLDQAQTTAFWKKELEGVQAVQYPQLPSPRHQPRANEVLTATVEGLIWTNKEYTAATVVRAAWALLLSAYSSSDEVIFGATLSGRQAAVAGVEEMPGPTIATVPVRVKVDADGTLRDMLQDVQRQTIETGPYEQAGLQNIRPINEETSRACDFQTLLVIQPAYKEEIANGLFVRQPTGHEHGVEATMNAYKTYAIVVEAEMENDGISLRLSHDSAVVDSVQAQSMLAHLKHLLQQMMAPEATQQLVRQVNTVNPEDLQKIWTWNAELPDTVNACVHDLIAETVRRQPEALAICAWDGELTYRQLNVLSTRLACRLSQLGIGHGSIVPLCFEKSVWMPVAQLAVMKAGGTSLALDSTHPRERLRAIVQQVRPTHIVCSSANQALASSLMEDLQTIVVDSALVTDLEAYEVSAALPTVNPSTELYMVFTSGSTGAPKGAVVTHSNISSALYHQQGAHGIVASSRVYDFASYAFDMAWSLLLQSLACGACLCVPSDADRKDDLAGSMKKLQVTIATFTPSTARLLPMSIVGALSTLVLGGERVSAEWAEKWTAQVELKNAYGPCECTPWSTIATVDNTSVLGGNIGKGFGVNVWIVDIKTGLSLSPVSSIGEIWLEGPIVGNGYFGDPQKTAAAFVEDPGWLLKGGPNHPGRRGRLYRTGDLGRYNTDGSITFVGRKDTQVKVRGNRVELDGVEHHVRRCLDNNHGLQIVAETITPRDSSNAILVIFVQTDGAQDCELSVAVKTSISKTQDKIVAQLPAYMVPTSYIPIRSIPMTGTGKTDRRRLQEIGASLTVTQLAAWNPSRGSRIAPTSSMEKTLQGLWASILGVVKDSISAEDSFLQIGGDSIAAMRLVGLARTQGVAFAVADLFQHPRLSDLAHVATKTTVLTQEDTAPFSLSKSNLGKDAVREQVAFLCNVDPAHIEDVYPCTPLQEGLLALTAQREGNYVARFIWELQTTIEPERLSNAWKEVVATTPILRTRIIELPQQGLMQVVIEESTARPLAITVGEIGTYLQANGQLETGLGKPLTGSGIVTERGSEGRRHFVWTIHHALYDGFSLALILRKLKRAYHGLESEASPPFQNFIKSLVDTDKTRALEFWRESLEGLEAQPFPVLPSPSFQPTTDLAIEHTITDLDWPRDDVTVSTAVRTAWAVLMGMYTDAEDVVFGATLTGRQAAVSRIDEIVGPTIATVPIRISMDRTQSISSLLQKVQKGAIDMMAAEQMGLQHIRRASADAELACRFQTLLVIQPEESQPNEDGDEYELFGQDQGAQVSDPNTFNTYALLLEFQLAKRGVHLHARFDSRVIEAKQVERMVQQLEQVLRQVCASGDTKAIAEIDACSPQDVRDIWAWNKSVSDSSQVPVHDLLSATAQRQPPGTMAVCAWDGDLTYAELDELSTRLAVCLFADHGVGPGIIVPLCFEKSMWTVVSIMAVMKAGGASVVMDATLPEDRLRQIAKQVSATVILSSAANEKLAGRLNQSAVVIANAASLAQHTPRPEIALPVARPSDTLYVVFTSGSTGTPKGVLVTHQNFATAFATQQSALGFTSGSRVFDFVSYAFDVAWSNVLHTLHAGGCLCIPSEDGRRSNTAQSMRDLKVNFADLTPTVVRLLDPADVPNLHTSLFSGEAVTTTDAAQWKSIPVLLNTYGPAETTVKTTVERILPGLNGDPSIGRGIGSNTWVTDRYDYQRLLPPGAIGELLIEGPLVFDSYLNNSTETNAALVEDPTWLLRGAPGAPGRRGRLYRTGDLVKYRADGSLDFMGRRDDQVKIRGQRIELGEVEAHVRRFLATDDGHQEAQVVAEVLKLEDGSRPILVAFIIPAKAMDLVEEDLEASVEARSKCVSQRLAEVVPEAMIPARYIPLRILPTTPTGKTDRRRLRQVGAAYGLERPKGLGPQQAIVAPAGPVETSLRDVWADVLNLPTESISVDVSFSRLGGDSITAMQAMSRCRAKNLRVTVADLLRLQTIQRLASQCTILPQHSASLPSPEQPDEPETEAGWVLSPIQQMFFDENTYSYNHFNQSFALKMRNKTNVAEIKKALLAVAERHSMLRARFRPRPADGKWEQYTLRFDPDAMVFEQHKNHDTSEIQSKAQERQRALDVENGPVFAVDVFQEHEEGQVLVLSAHHLVIDLVSWRVIWRDFQDALDGTTLGKPPVSFQQWCKLQQLDGQTLKPAEVLPFSVNQPRFDYWDVRPEDNVRGDIQPIIQALDAEATSLLLGRSNEAFCTDVVDILVAMLDHTFRTSFDDREAPAIYFEGHGREAIGGQEYDVSDTVGWFTTMHPLQLALAAGDDAVAAVQAAKKVRGQVPAKGRPYMACQCYSGAVEQLPGGMEVLLNYIGRFQQLEDEASKLTTLARPMDLRQSSPEIRRSALVEVTVNVEDGQMVVLFDISTRMKHQAGLRRWSEAFAVQLSKVARTLAEMEPVKTDS